MSTVNERLRAQNTALLIWLQACVKKLGGEITIPKAELDRLQVEMADQNRGDILDIMEEADSLKLFCRSISPIVTADGKAQLAASKEAAPVLLVTR